MRVSCTVGKYVDTTTKGFNYFQKIISSIKKRMSRIKYFCSLLNSIKIRMLPELKILILLHNYKSYTNNRPIFLHYCQCRKKKDEKCRDFNRVHCKYLVKSFSVKENALCNKLLLF